MPFSMGNNSKKAHLTHTRDLKMSSRKEQGEFRSTLERKGIKGFCVLFFPGPLGPFYRTFAKLSLFCSNEGLHFFLGEKIAGIR